MLRERPLCSWLEARSHRARTGEDALGSGQWAGLSQMSRHISGGLIINRHPGPASLSAALHGAALFCTALLLRRPFEPSDPDTLFVFPSRPPTHVHALQPPIPSRTSPLVAPPRTSTTGLQTTCNHCQVSVFGLTTHHPGHLLPSGSISGFPSSHCSSPSALPPLPLISPRGLLLRLSSLGLDQKLKGVAALISSSPT